MNGIVLRRKVPYSCFSNLPGFTKYVLFLTTDCPQVRALETNKKEKKNNSNFFRIIIVKRLMYLQKNTASSKTWSTVSSTNTPKFGALFCSMTCSFHSIVTLYSTITKKWKCKIQTDFLISITDTMSQKIFKLTHEYL